jgi:hypothetical protein
MPARRLLSALLLAAVIARTAHADGAPLGPVPTEDLSRPAVTSDGHGGALVTYKTASLKLGAVHVNGNALADGGIGFAPATMPFTLEAGEPVRVSLPTDSQVVLGADRATSSSPVITSVRSGGTASPGFPVGVAMAHRYPVLVRGLAGRTLIVSKNSDAVSFWTLRAAIIGANGVVQSAVQLPSAVQFFSADRLDATTDGAGGLIAVFPYYDVNAGGSKDLAVFKYTATGARPWGDVPRPMVFAANDQTDPHIIPDGAGGALFAWTDPRAVSRGSDVFALHIDKDAQRVAGWGFYGQAVCDALGEQSQPRLTSDGFGGAWVVWKDQRDDLAGDLRCSHVLANGSFAPGFTSAGRELCTAPGVQAEADVAGDGAGGFYAVWRDERSGNADIYAQHVLSNGTLPAGWPVNGRALTTATGTQEQPAIASISAGRAVIAWRDGRSSPARIYATAVVDAGTTDTPAPGAGALRIAVAGAAGNELRVRLSLPAPGAAHLDVLDLSGRVRARLDVSGPLDGVIVSLRAGAHLEPGLYFARVRQGANSASARATLLR